MSVKPTTAENPQLYNVPPASNWDSNPPTSVVKNASKDSGPSTNYSTKKVTKSPLNSPFQPNFLYFVSYIDDELKDKNNKFNFTGPLRPGNISARSQVPGHIKMPDWAKTGIPHEELNSKF